jgi:membrane-bound metal-dependent hydrolase YbcI (DUF457 family)
MMYRTHFGTGLLFGLSVDLGAVLTGHPFPVVQAAALPLACGYFSPIPDVDHRNAKIRFAVPPARWLFLFVRTLVGLSAGAPRLRRRWLVVPCLDWGPASERRMDYWMDHRRITHTIDFAVWLGILIELPVLWFGLWWWIGLAVTLGCLAHRLGDRLTDRGVPAWSWRLDVRRGWRIDTDSIGESTFALMQGAVCVGMCWALLGAPVPA